MEKTKADEELLKDKIYDIFIKCKSELSSDRRQFYIGRLAELIFIWCRDYIKFKVYDKRAEQSEIMGAEIFNIVMRPFKEKSKANVPEDRSGYFGYIINSLKTAKNEYRKNFMSKNENSIIRMKESYFGRKLTEDEKDNVINKWFDHEVVENTNIDYLINSDIDIILKAIKAVLDKKQDRSRDCYRALLTLHCIDNVDLYPVLDRNIIETCQQINEKPKQYEIYQKYHTEASKSGAEVMASKNLRELLNDLKTYLKEKNPEIFQ